MRRLWHALAHLSGTWTGWPVSWYSADGQRVLRGFECGYCGDVTHITVRDA